MDLIAIGKIRTSHGVKGFLKVSSFSGESEHFLNIEEIVLVNGEKKKTFQVEFVRGSHPSILMKLKGIDSPETARQYRGWEIWVHRTQASPLKDGEFYIADLINCRVYFENIEKGIVTSVWEAPQSMMLDVKIEDNGTVVVPFQEQFIGQVNIEKKLIELLVDWILE